MRLTIDIDEKLLKEAMAVTKCVTKKEFVTAGLKELIRIKRIERLVGRFGKTRLNLSLRDLERMRRDE